MAGTVQLVALQQIGPPSARFLDRKICIQIAVALLGFRDQIDGFVGLSLQSGIRVIFQAIRDGFQPLGHIAVLEHKPSELAFH